MISSDLWKIWLLIDPRVVLIALGAFLIVLGLAIHMILLSTAEFNWLEDGVPAASVQQVTPVVPQR
ncbi:light-harvesting antenna LH1, alpha subunit [Thiocystis violascens]|uniref:Antenna complex alpha/beta subunit n=1 Tax=Thiocystis violascens (strain ATCC 17096 / DSM 198 / 6111) TaxID=765911 RepID=I3YAE1_THIV6|nr:light-harvesting antenna LH1, alpha subunit [Thiocystis violascens]AFL73959.1 Antenna complex alpha/beta subunit [Thiocystis violascens DSM 198]